ncbi:MogA/MoaB family molybdenum cofactor biosynthesis protein [Halostagnicola kamekurae]|uniref:Molybdenum cofactor biosynthesis protein B n=1 Tax=Halostagnicola kamekurae TaxID=619731 RepID=A0A1I6S9F1_9EURY|nr:molybdopterin-binding protein [Halostagnicola kamekurae]SFS73378.1 molybdenum cofactor biosynthesis protein B [Halostagnicola kamekurae]
MTAETGAESTSEEEPSNGEIGVAVVTISADGRIEDDAAGDAIVAAFDAEDHEIAIRELIDRSYDNVQAKVSRLLDRDDVDIVVTAGGTGIGPEDATIEAVRPLLEKELSAFSELFYALAFDEIGTKAVTSRTLAGVSDRTPIFCLPNEPVAISSAVESIIVPEADRLVALASGPDSDGGA